MTPTSAATTPRPRRVVQLAATVRHDRPEYRYVGGGRFEPANDLAREECRRFNAWVDEVNARTTRSVRQ